MSFYVNSNNKRLGPLTEEEVKAELASGRFKRSDLGIREGEPDWKQLEELFPSSQGVQSKKGRFGRFIGWAFVVIGLLLFVVGVALALRCQSALNDPSKVLGCTDADKAKTAADAVYEQVKNKHLENIRLDDPNAISRLSGEDRALLKSFDDKRYAMEGWGRTCGEFLAGYRQWRLIYILVAVAGLIGSIIGALFLKMRS